MLDALAAGAASGRDEADLIETFAYPLPVTVICELLGVPVRDQDRFREWSHAIVATEENGDFRTAGAEMFYYFTDLVAAKRARPADDLVSALIEASDAGSGGAGSGGAGSGDAGSGDALNERELIAMLFLLLIAGHETTTNLIASGTLALLTNPSQLSRLRDDPSLSLAVDPASLRWRRSSLIHGLEALPVRLR